MDSYFLKLNPDKTKIIVFTPSKHLQDSISINGTFLGNNKTCVRFSDNANNLGILFDKYLLFKPQVDKVVSSCFLTIKNLSKIRPYLNVKDLKILAVRYPGLF